MAKSIVLFSSLCYWTQAMAHLRINTIYRATEGEGIHIGTPQIFVRLQGCQHKCLNCDSKETWDFDDGQAWPVDSVTKEVAKLSLGLLKRVSITGGDPLLSQNLDGLQQLIQSLKLYGYFLNLEVSGSRIVHHVFDLVDFIGIDCKTPSSGLLGKLETIIEMRRQYAGRFQVKSVIQTREDFDFVVGLYNQLLLDKNNKVIDFPWCLTPAYNANESFPLQRFIDITQWNENFGNVFRIIGQQHKWIHGPNKRMV